MKGSLSFTFWRKIKQEMRIQFLQDKKPKSKLKLSSKEPDDLNIDVDMVTAWSIDNQELYKMLLDNGFTDFICNREALYEHYENLCLIDQNIEKIDNDSINFVNLKFLKLNENKITVLQNIPASCLDLFLYNNEISSVKLNKKTKIRYLGLGNNKIDQQSLRTIVDSCPQLRSLDICYNNLINLESSLEILKKSAFLKVLSLYGNPISLLKHYYKVVTKELSLTYFDEAKYVKEEKKKTAVLLPPIQQKKQQKKETKKDAKKDAKKQTKKEEEPPPPPKVEEPPAEQVIADMNGSTLVLNISVLEDIKGILLDSNQYQQFSKSPDRFQTTYWLQYNGPQGKTISKPILFESAVTEDQKSRVTFNEVVNHPFKANLKLRDYISQGITIEIWKSEPVMKTEGDSEEKKPEMKDGLPVATKTMLGVVRVSLASLFKSKVKKQQNRYRLFPQKCLNEPNFFYAEPDENESIERNKKVIEAEIEKQKEDMKKAQEVEQLAKQQKKGGKDAKKPAPAADKKAAKKGGKQEAEEKKAIPLTNYEIHPRQYVFVEDGKIIRSFNSYLSVSAQIK